MVIVFNKNTDSNISSIDCGEMTADVFKWNVAGAASHIMDTSNFKIKIGAIDTIVTFASLEAMMIYIDQFDVYLTLINPKEDGISNDPYYDKVNTGSVQSHTYIDTNIEQDLINGGTN